VVLPLLAGVTFVCALGVWLGFRRVGSDIAGLRAALRRRPAATPAAEDQAR
jgi:hypothetical protein